MALFRRKGPGQVPPPAPPSSTQTSARSVPTGPVPADLQIDWSDIDNIRAEWPESALDPEDDLRKRDEGISLYNEGPNQSAASTLRAATLLAPSLAHSLYGEGILRGQDLIDTVYKTLFASLDAADDRTFPEDAQRIARLALTLVRENGWQPAAMGGDGLFDNVLTEKYATLVLPMVISPTKRPWDGDLKAFFAVPPRQLVPTLPDPDDEKSEEVITRMHALLTRDHDDPGRALHKKGMLLWAGGQSEDALAILTEAAELGTIQAMKDAGDLAKEIGQDDKSWFWYETAANAGNADSMWNMATHAFNSGDLAGAADWYKRSAEAGLLDGYAALTQLASDRDDAAAERHWAKLGAESGQTFCMSRHGLLLMMDSDGTDVIMMRRAREFLEQAADRGSVDAMGLAVTANAQLGEPDRGQRFAQMVVDSGNEEEIDRLKRYGFL